MKLHEIVDMGPVVFYAPNNSGIFGEVFNVTNNKLYRYTLGENEKYAKSGVKTLEHDLTLDDIVELAADWWTTIISDQTDD